MVARKEERAEWKAREDGFEHGVGDEVTVNPPHAGWGVWGEVEEQVSPLEYPKRELSSGNLVYVPGTRKWGTTTRKRSYLVRLKPKGCEAEDMWLWAIESCVRKG